METIVKPTIEMPTSPIRLGVSMDFGRTWESFEHGHDELYAHCLLGLGWPYDETAEEVGITVGQAREITRGTCKFYGTLKRIGIEDWRTWMNAARIEATLRGMNGIAKKVFEAVPKADPWTAQQICSELYRLGTKCDLAVTTGCLNTLKTSGLVIEKPTGHFVQIYRKPTTVGAALADALAAKETPVEQKPIPAPAAPLTATITVTNVMSLSKDEPLKRMADLASELRSFASRLEDIALDIATRDQKNSADTAKLRQLQALLRGLES